MSKTLNYNSLAKIASFANARTQLRLRAASKALYSDPLAATKQLRRGYAYGTGPLQKLYNEVPKRVRKVKAGVDLISLTIKRRQVTGAGAQLRRINLTRHLLSLVQGVYRAYKLAVKTGSQIAEYRDSGGLASARRGLSANVNSRINPDHIFSSTAAARRDVGTVTYTMPREYMMTALLTAVKPILAELEAVIEDRLRRGQIAATNIANRIRTSKERAAYVRGAEYIDFFRNGTIAARAAERVARRAARRV